jgi:protein subunit release factor B
MTENGRQRELMFSVTLADCDVYTTRGHGKGGQNRNKRDTAVRIVHRDSGAVGYSQDERSQLQNKRAAFRRMTQTKEFQVWLKMRTGEDARVLAAVDQAMWPVHIKTEVRKDGKWVTE